MPERLNWLKTLPAPLQEGTSYDPGALANVALHARLCAGAGSTLPVTQRAPLPVLHWWSGTMGRAHPTRDRREPWPIVCLLLESGSVRWVWGWPTNNNWLDFVLSLDPSRLRSSPLRVLAEATREPKLTDPVWRFRLGD